MKKSKFIIPLILLNVLIWGYAVYSAVSFGENDAEIKIASPVKLSESVTQGIPDTLKLKLNYEDPFLKKENARYSFTPKSKTNTGTKKASKKLTNTKEVKEVTWPDVSYLGMIHNQITGKKLALFNVNGAELMLELGKQENEIKLLNVYKDSVKVSYKGNAKYLKNS